MIFIYFKVLKNNALSIDYLKEETIDNAKKSPYFVTSLSYYENVATITPVKYLILICLFGGFGLFLTVLNFNFSKKTNSNAATTRLTPIQSLSKNCF